MAHLPERMSNGKLPAFTSIGCYTLIYMTRRCDVLCADCATEALDTEADDPPVACDAFFEGSPHSCANCNAVMQSSYGDPECSHASKDADGNCTVCGGS